MSEPLRWGILGTGNIANQFAAGVGTALRGRIVAVGSRKESTARTFADRYQVATALGSYEQVLQDPDVQAVYISLPNSMHHEWAIKSLRAGKHVLCEKPLAADSAQAREMFDEAQRCGRLLVEAFMYRSHPQHQAIVEQVEGGAIGRLQMIRTSFCFYVRNTQGNIRFDAGLAGGSLMDVGCYCINLSRCFAGQEPRAVHATARLHAGGVDELAAGTMYFDNGIIASFTCGMTVQVDNTAYLCGTEGYIEIPVPWKPAVQRAEYAIVRSTPPRMDQAQQVRGPVRQVFQVSADRPLYALEADDFAAAVAGEKRPAISPEDSLGNIQVLDQMRRQIHADAT
jgi:predicted dehydrogenase